VAPAGARNGLLKAFDPDRLVNLTDGDLPEDLRKRYEYRVVGPPISCAAPIGQADVGLGSVSTSCPSSGTSMKKKSASPPSPPGPPFLRRRGRLGGRSSALSPLGHTERSQKWT